MSLRGRYVIDRVKRAVSRYLRLPVPPYQNPAYWEGVYQRLGPDDVFEWGSMSCADLMKYRYSPIDYRPGQSESHSDTSSAKVTTLGETLGVYPEAPTDEPILILGSGNSKLGEDMLEAKWRGPIIQCDVSSRAIEAMSQRCAHFQTTGDMQFVTDDATVLSAFNDNKIAAVIDKGLVDALFCTESYDQCYDVMRAVHRVLIPGGVFAFLSFSRPEFIMERLLIPPKEVRKPPRSSFTKWEIRELDSILLYRFQKADKDRLRK